MYGHQLYAKHTASSKFSINPRNLEITMLYYVYIILPQVTFDISTYISALDLLLTLTQSFFLKFMFKNTIPLIEHFIK